MGGLKRQFEKRPLPYVHSSKASTTRPAKRTADNRVTDKTIQQRKIGDIQSPNYHQIEIQLNPQNTDNQSKQSTW